MNGAERIAKERQRQVDEVGWSADHDDEHESAEMAMAAVCYAACAAGERIYEKDDFAASVEFKDPWPWDQRWDARPYNGNVLKRPTKRQRIRLLEKAGALLAAEIDRLLRKPKATP